jgi:hypothetical protein
VSLRTARLRHGTAGREERRGLGRGNARAGGKGSGQNEGRTSGERSLRVPAPMLVDPVAARRLPQDGRFRWIPPRETLVHAKHIDRREARNDED